LSGSNPDNSLNFNVSISYADFWSDTPADDIFNNKQVQYFRTTDTLEELEISSTGGNNGVPSKGFWIAFHFNDGRQLFFNVPPGPSASLYRVTYLFFQETCAA